MSIGRIAEFDVQSGSWRSYCDRLESYFVVNDVKEERKLPTLISVVGDAAYELMVNLCSPKKPATMTYKEIVEVMEKHLQPTPSVLAERFKFRQYRQVKGQTAAQYVAELKKMARFCEFGATLDENMRDQFVCGLFSDAVRQRLFADGNINFKRAVSLALSLEAAERDSNGVVRENTQRYMALRYPPAQMPVVDPIAGVSSSGSAESGGSSREVGNTRGESRAEPESNPLPGLAPPDPAAAERTRPDRLRPIINPPIRYGFEDHFN